LSSFLNFSNFSSKSSISYSHFSHFFGTAPASVTISGSRGSMLEFGIFTSLSFISSVVGGSGTSQSISSNQAQLLFLLISLGFFLYLNISLNQVSLFS